MTTITIDENISDSLPKTRFKNLAELFQILHNLAPIKLYHDDEESFSEDTLKTIEISKKNANKKLTDFQ